MIEKRFPATVSLELTSFLNDKKVDGELYALLQEYSIGENHETVVYKSDLPIQKEICARLGIKSPKTYRVHRDYLIENGYLIDDGDKYILPRMEDIYFMIPLKTLQYLNDTIKEQVIKIYIYLGQRWKYKKNYIFTIEELGKHIGISTRGHSRPSQTINNALDVLVKLGLIEFEEVYDDNFLNRKKLTYFTTEIVIGKIKR